MSPALLGFDDEFGPEDPGYKRLTELKSQKEVTTAWNEMDANFLIAVGRAYTPNAKKPPFFADLPYTYENGKTVLHQEILDIWQRNTPIMMIDSYVENLKNSTPLN
ncbi:hypothetical protein [Flavobacterium sp. 3HN19-14]|uniref:hypothetical protein n=1 Tax=Flavobacterium sp. 3HN19-14 TaxID=3448133 RepID=UPI003EE11FCE